MASDKLNHTNKETLELDFDIDGSRKGHVSVSVQPNNDPRHYGCDLLFTDKPWDCFATYPVCEASVRSTGVRGYGCMYGWIQMVRNSTSPLTASDAWEMDPLPILGDLKIPFTLFGPEPSLFDCPMRENQSQYDWICHSFLTYIPDCLISKDVRPILGFEWGFRIEDGKVQVKALRKLENGE